MNEAWNEKSESFGWFQASLDGKCPDWHANPFTGVRSSHANQPWWFLPDFDPRLGDIKTVWEASRWDWVVIFALRAQSGDEKATARLNFWLANWTEQNQPYLGVNWKCGQEASIRVIHLAMSAVILNQVNNPDSPLLDLIRIHLQRIAPTIQYAIAQNNNHGTSEAAALFIGGSWLKSVLDEPQGENWAALGRKWIENRVAGLIEIDGSFSQYSVNYHRMLLDTLSITEFWRRYLELPKFSEKFVTRAVAATDWLMAFVDSESGDVPNIGANDGARLFPITQTDYRDYRPSVQLASVLFSGRQKYPPGPWDNLILTQHFAVESFVGEKSKSRLFDNGGYAVLCWENTKAYLRYPRFRFRPSHADALHVDLWVGSRNVLRDGGSFSYADPKGISYFCGTESHNTIQFGDRDQMPRIGRFLFGEWLKTKQRKCLKIEANQVSFTASYKDWKGAKHRRKLNLSSRRLRVIDQIEGMNDSAVIRWRLEPDEWELEGDILFSPTIKIQVEADIDLSRIELMQGQESRYYMRVDEIPVLEVEVSGPGTVTTNIEWAKNLV
ncbi:heparinase II/III-family protein [Akkermansiaceae bacterium]|nr:heparinase II/III-family protein [Akkermansiaceae bacterium]